MDRREFLKQSGLGLAAGATAFGAGRPVAIDVSKDAVAQSAPVQWALGELKKVVTLRDDAPFRISIGGAHLVAAAVPEAFTIIPAANKLNVRAYDPLGLVYAINELDQSE